jgi:hypothetical protein
VRCGRRIALPRGAGCLELAFAPHAPRRGPPTATFSGGGAAAAELQARWFSGAAAAAWSEGRGVAESLEAALGVAPPPPGRQQAAALAALRRPLPAIGAGAAARVAHGCKAGADSAGGGSETGAGSEGASSSDDEEEEEGACGICYALQLRDPAAPDGHPGAGLLPGLVVFPGEDSAIWAGSRLRRRLHRQDLGAAACAGDARVHCCRQTQGAGPALRPGCSHPTPGDVPDAACDAAGGCGRPFHSRCLAEWVRGLPGSRRCFATLFGQCPYCSAPVAVRAAWRIAA